MLRPSELVAAVLTTASRRHRRLRVLLVPSQETGGSGLNSPFPATALKALSDDNVRLL